MPATLVVDDVDRTDLLLRPRVCPGHLIDDGLTPRILWQRRGPTDRRLRQTARLVRDPMGDSATVDHRHVDRLAVGVMPRTESDNSPLAPGPASMMHDGSGDVWKSRIE